MRCGVTCCGCVGCRGQGVEGEHKKGRHISEEWSRELRMLGWEAREASVAY